MNQEDLREQMKEMALRRLFEKCFPELIVTEKTTTDILWEEIFKNYGKCMYGINLIEREMIDNIFIVMLNDNPNVCRNYNTERTWHGFIDKFYSTREKKTFGELRTELKEALKKKKEFNQIIEQLGQIKKERNHLTHHYFFQTALEQEIEEGLRTINVELQHLSSYIYQVHDDLAKIMQPLKDRLGMTEERIMKESDKALKEAMEEYKRKKEIKSDN